MGARAKSPGQMLSLPQGGGGVQGIGETFAPDLFTGTGNLSVPIVIPPGRSGLQPHLSLSYSTGQGNGPFGSGWSVGVPAVRRKTSAGVPVYDDGQDTFILAGAEDLVPADPADKSAYRPRTEGLFARINHVRGGDDDYWRVKTKDGLTSWYGTPGRAGDDPAALADPRNPRRVFAWFISRCEDPYGNRIEYDYLPDPGRPAAAASPAAVNSPGGDRRSSQLLLSSIRYAEYGSDPDRRFLVSVRLIYEDRPDPFSDCRAGFEIRTSKRCRALEAWTETADGVTRLFRRYRLSYSDPAAAADGASLLCRVDVEGEDGVERQSMPPLEFGYTAFEPAKRRFMPIECPEPPVVPLSTPTYQLADLNADGLPDILELDGVIRYWRNRGGGRLDGPRQMEFAPAGFRLDDPGVELLDADGDGRIDLMVSGGRLAGYFPMGGLGFWDAASFRPYRVAPSFDLKDPRVRLLDLDGDGVTDAMRSGSRLECFFNDPQAGWDATRSVEWRADFGPLDFADPRLHTADMNGDGLPDLALVYDGAVRYWPSLGRGAFGAPVIMRSSPRFPYGYDPRRVLVGDVDGDGAADLVYVDDGRATLWLNRHGNDWSAPVEVAGTPPVTNADDVRLADMLGTGVSGVLWTGPALAPGRPTMCFLDFMGGVKPYLLCRVDNHIGVQTSIEYASSTAYYVADAGKKGARWQTSLPFPVQVVARTTQTDSVSHSQITSEYSYHHGYWDGVEREFRGFGRVEQRDARTAPPEAPLAPAAPPESADSPPVLVRTWFHLGPAGDAVEWRVPDFQGEYWPGDAPALSWPDMPKKLDRRALRDAARSLRGHSLRSEMYSQDGGDREPLPYSVAEWSYGVRVELAPGQLPPGQRAPGLARPGCYFPYSCAERTAQWERGDAPLTRVTFWDDYDDRGKARKESVFAAPRGRDYRRPGPAGAPYLATLSVTDYARPVDAAVYIDDRPARVTQYEVLNDGGPALLDLHDAVIGGAAQTRIVGQTLHFYDGAAFAGRDWGEVGEFGAPVRTETLAFTLDTLRQAYRGDGTRDIPPYLDPNGPPPWSDDYPEEFRRLLPPLASYIYHDGAAGSPFAAGYWAATDRTRYDFHDGRGRGLAVTLRDPMGRDTLIAYDEPYGLLPVRVERPSGLVTTASYDYRLLERRSTVDPNGNRVELTFTPLGMVASRAEMGRPGEPGGDTPEVPGTRWSYDFSTCPISVRATQREYHATDDGAPPPERDQVIEAVEYFDGFGRSVQTRAQAEDVRFGDPDWGEGLLAADQSQPVGPAVGERRDPADPPRTVASGRTVYDNKGRVVERYEPFFSRGWDFTPVTDGKRVVMRYDPRGQLVRTQNPDGSERLVVCGAPFSLDDPSAYAPSPWETFTYDENDNAGRTHPERSRPYAAHWNTPSSVVIDALGRTVVGVTRLDKSPAGECTVRNTYDILGNLLAATDPLGRVVFRGVYDLAGQTWRAELLDAGAERVVLDADGHPVERRDARGALMLYAYDGLARQVLLWARDGAVGPVTLRVRSVWGDSPDSGLSRGEAAAKNLLGRLYQEYDEAGVLTLAPYDFKGNVREKSRVVIAGDRGALTPPAGPYVLTYAYDALNRVCSQRYPEDVTGARRELRLSYSRAGALETVALDGRVYVERIAYNARGQRTLAALGNGVMIRCRHDPDTFRLDRMRSEPYTQPDPLTYQPRGAPLQDIGYGYDLLGNPLALRMRAPGDGVPGHPDAFDRDAAYDPLYRLTSATGRECGDATEPPWANDLRCQALDRTRAYAEAYSYDNAGNLLALRRQAPGGGFGREYALVPASNRLASLSVDGAAYPYAYDDAGNVIGEAGRRLAWNWAGRLTAFDPGGGAPGARYWYEAGGQRIASEVLLPGDVRQSTVYVDVTFEHRRQEGAGAAREHNLLHIMDGDRCIAALRVGDPFPGDESPDVQYYLTDHLGSSNIVVGAGEWCNREEYTPFGETSLGSYPHKRYRFTGHERDAESGLYHAPARFYAPYLGRWVSVDPVGIADGLNLYGYAGDNPMRFVDRTGTTNGDPQQQQPNTTTLVSSGVKEHLVRSAGNMGFNLDQFVTRLFHPVHVDTGKLLFGPLNLFSTEPGRQMALKAFGYTIEGTKHFKLAMTLQGGRTNLPTDEFRAIWDTASRTLVKGAKLSGQGTVSFGLGLHKAPFQTVQWRAERLAAMRYGAIKGGMMGLSGFMNMYSGAHSKSTVQGALLCGGGMMQVTGGILFGIPKWTTKAFAEAGRNVFLCGGVISSIPSAMALPENVRQGQWLQGGQNLVTTLSPSLTLLGSLTRSPMMMRAGLFCGMTSLVVELGRLGYYAFTTPSSPKKY